MVNSFYCFYGQPIIFSIFIACWIVFIYFSLDTNSLYVIISVQSKNYIFCLILSSQVLQPATFIYWHNCIMKLTSYWIQLKNWESNIKENLKERVNG